MKKKMLPVVFIVSSLVLALLPAPADIRALVAAAVIGLCLGVGLYRYTVAPDRNTEKNVPSIIVGYGIGAALCAVAMRGFYNTWRRANIVKAIAASMQMSHTTLVNYCAGALGVIAFPAAVLAVRVALRRRTHTDDRREEACRVGLCVIFALALVMLQLIMLQFSAINDFRSLSSMKPMLFKINLLALIAFDALLCAAFGRVSTAFAVGVGLTFCWSLANYYVTLFHGSPLFFSEFANFKTAADVASGYSFKVDNNVKELLRLLFWQTVLSIALFRNSAKPTEKRVRRRMRLLHAALAVLSGAIVLISYANPSIKPRNGIAWDWKNGVVKFGYITCIYEDVVNRINPVIKPDGYSVRAVEEIPLNGSESREEEYPDIILILNESFFDLTKYTELPTDTDYLKGFYSIDGAHYGTACVPAVGGCTNNSEMELLTSNSMYLLPVSAPFNYLDFTTDKNTLGASLQADGYDTTAMHTSKTNYSRHKVYPLIGFRQVVLGRDNYNHFETYGNRKWTDAGNYEDLKEIYQSMSEGPRFVYMLTYQNHGDYDKNDPSWDLVHSLRSFGERDPEINEYLTSVSMSGDAFVALTDYFRTVDRRVIICMSGDHAPNFISRIPGREGMTNSELPVARRAVPYVVWANYDLPWPDNASRISLMDLGPLLKQAAGLPLSTYDQQILDLHEEVPVRTSAGIFVLPDGTYGSYDPQGTDRGDELFRQYLFMEYNLLKGGADYRAELFEAGEADPASGGA